MTQTDPQGILKSLHRAKTVKARAAIITEVEHQGGAVAFLNGRYTLFLDGTCHSLPRKVCERCRKPYRQDLFWGGQGAEYPWCLACRNSDPRGAKKAFDHARFHARYQAMSEAERAAWQKHVKERHTR